MKYSEFEKQLKEDKLYGAYLLYGEEEYLKQECVEMLDSLLPEGYEFLNKTVLEGAAAADIYDAAVVAPFMCEKRIVIAKDPLFIKASQNDEDETDDAPAGNKKADKPQDDTVTKLLTTDFSTSIIIIYVRGTVDKRKKVFKQFDAVSRTVEFPLLYPDELIRWITNKVQKEGGKITYPASKMLAESVGGSITAVLPELQKLMAYKKSELIDVPDVESFVSSNVEASVFSMIDSLFSDDKRKAYELLQDMLLSNEQPIMILNLISRQLRLLTYVKSLLNQGVSRAEIQRQLELKSFAANKLFDICSGLQQQWLSRAYAKSIETDYLIKSGKIAERQGLDEMIALLASK